MLGMHGVGHQPLGPLHHPVRLATVVESVEHEDVGGEDVGTDDVEHPRIHAAALLVARRTVDLVLATAELDQRLEHWGAGMVLCTHVRDLPRRVIGIRRGRRCV